MGRTSDQEAGGPPSTKILSLHCLRFLVLISWKVAEAAQRAGPCSANRSAARGEGASGPFLGTVLVGEGGTESIESEVLGERRCWKGEEKVLISTSNHLPSACFPAYLTFGSDSSVGPAGGVSVSWG